MGGLGLLVGGVRGDMWGAVQLCRLHIKWCGVIYLIIFQNYATNTHIKQVFYEQLV